MFKSLLALLGFVIFAPLTTGVNCGDTITHSMTLDQDLYCIGHDGLVIEGENITLDCAGHTISTNYYGSGALIYVYASTNVTVKNCVLNGTAIGIAIDDWNPTASDPFDYPGFNTIVNNTIFNVDWGIHLTGARNNTIANNTIINIGLTAIWISQGGDLNITNNFIEGHDAPLMFGSSNKLIILGNSVHGINANQNYIGGADSFLFVNNTVVNVGYGLLVSGISRAVIVNNSFNFDNDVGTCVYFDMNTPGGLVSNNVFWTNAGSVWGADLGMNDNATVTNNNFTGITWGDSLGGNHSLIEHNNFWVSSTKAGADYGSNVWKNNYYMRYDGPAEGCNDTNLDFICDLPYPIYPGYSQDSSPYTSPSGWLNMRPPWGGSPIFTKVKYNVAILQE